MHDIVKLVKREEPRLIALLGLAGIGKSTVAKEAVHYMSDRKYFTGGVLFFNMKNFSYDSFFIQLKRIIPKEKFPARENLDNKIFLE